MWVEHMRALGFEFGNLWGFDSFQGIPPSDDVRNSPDLRSKWGAGMFNAAETLALKLGARAYNFTFMSEYITDQVGYGRDKTILVRGYYNQSLPALPPSKRARMQTAMLVDLDCDIYEATMEAMHFLITQRIVRPGTIVYYDDWLPGRPIDGVGQRKAFVELTKTYTIDWHAILGPDEKPLQFLYQVKSLQVPPS
jgi:hypothetical protein